MQISMLRRDRAIRTFPKWFIVVVLTASFFSGVRAFMIRAAGGGSPDGSLGYTAILVAALWIPVALYLFYAGTIPRSTRLDLALPVDPRDLWLTHLVAVTLSALCMLIAGAAVIALQSRGLRLSMPDLGLWFDQSPGGVIPVAIAGLFLGSVIINGFDTAVYKARLTRRYGWSASATLAGLFVLILVLSHRPAVSALALVPLAAALWWARRTYARIPPAFALVPARTDVADAGGGGEASVRTRSSTAEDFRQLGTAGALGRHRVISRVVWEWWGILYFALLLALGALLAGAPYNWTGDADTRFANVSIIWYMLFVLFPPAMKRLHKVDPLPVSRRSIFAHLVIPSVMCLVVAYGANEAALGLWGTTGEDLKFRKLDCCFYLSVPVEACEFSWGDPSPNTAPWGESHEAWSTELVQGVPLRVYSPFSTPEGSSIDFVSWQMARAVRAVYNAEIPAEEIRRRYLVVDDEGRVAPKTGSLSIRVDYPDLEPSGRGRIFPIAMVLAAVPALLLAAGYFRMFRSCHGPFARTAAAVAILGTTLGLHIAVYSHAVVASSSLWAWTGAVKIFARRATDLLPGGIPTLWILCMLALVGAYRIAEREFGRIEVPPPSRKPVD